MLFHFLPDDIWCRPEEVGMLFPGQRLACSPLPCQLRQFFEAPDTAWIAFMPDVPERTDSDTILVEVYLTEGTQHWLTDLAVYRRNAHLPDLRNIPDISLVRSSLDEPAVLAGSWTSSRFPGMGATPGWTDRPLEQNAGTDTRMELEGQVGPLDLKMQWVLSWQLPSGNWKMMAELFTVGGRYLGELVPAVAVVRSGKIHWGWEDVGKMLPVPGVYLLSVRCWSDNGDSLRRTLPAIALPP